jgi:hypothetical protein
MMAGMSSSSDEGPYCLDENGFPDYDAPVRGVYTYDGPLGLPPDTLVVYDMTPPEGPESSWTPLRDRPRATKCYRMASGAMVHFKPDCRC